jgi:hypothetical protein
MRNSITSLSIIAAAASQLRLRRKDFQLFLAAAADGSALQEDRRSGNDQPK